MIGPQERFQHAMNQGHSAAWDQNWNKAAEYYRQALEELPDHPKALSSLALALYESQNFQEALKYYQRAAEVSPNDPVPLEKVAGILERMGHLAPAVFAYMEAAEMYARSRDIEKAIENWSSVISLNPEHLPAHSRLAVVYERLGRKPQALTEYISIASLLQQTGEVQKAIQTIQHLQTVIPESTEARQALNMLQSGRALPKPRRPRSVTGPLVMAKVRELEPSKSEQEERPRQDPIREARQKALTMLADLLFEQSPEPEGAQVRLGLQSIVRGTGILGHNVDHTKVLLHVSQAIDLQSHGDDSLAIGELQHAIDAGLDSSAVYFDLGLLLSNTDRVESAIRALQHSVKHETFAMATRLLLGQIYTKLGRHKEAAQEYLEALRLADTESVSPEQAEEVNQLYDPIVETFAHNPDPQLPARISANVSDLLLHPDWRRKMKTARQQLPAAAPDSPPVPLAEMLTEAGSSQVVESLVKINQLARKNKLRTAMEEAFYALSIAPTYLPLHICIGDLLVQEDHIPEAVKKFTVVAESYNVRGEANRAITLMRKVGELAPMDMDARNRLIDLMMARGQIDEAIKELLKLAESYYALADLGMAHKTYSRALRYAQQANADRQIKVKILHLMADIDMQSLDWRNALRVFEQIRTLQPDDEKARGMLVDLNFRLNQSAQALSELDNYLSHLLNSAQHEKALEAMTNLVNEYPNLPALHRRMSEVYRHHGRITEAIDALDITGDLYLQAGNKAGAIEAIVALLALNPPNAEQYQQVLAQLRAEKPS
jgi:tetratricopeptide (TPR) repeat protein